ncbi:unnamed protein product [Thelazia callipaeda]|uniref:WD_REPEATS_REGION domain-containing protein n=1 Tax=Thelazia callipaeda TaxID=103827 RepID=A0A158RBJ9_THECL|nr:unnamed protein product [Thelazia callipaeda]
MMEQFSASVIFNDQQRDLIHHVAFDFHGRRIATSSSDMMVCVWNLSPNGNWVKSASWKSHSGPVWKVVWAHPEFGQILATCSFDRSVTIWEETVRQPVQMIINSGIQSGQKEQQPRWKRCCQLVDSRHNVTDIKFAPRHLGLMLATVSSQGVLRIYEAPDIMNLSMWSLNQDIAVFRCRCSCLSWSTNRLAKPLIAVGSDDAHTTGKRVAIYEYHDNLRKWQLLNVPSLKISESVTDIAFAPPAGRSYHILAIGSKDIFLFKLSSNGQSTDLNGDLIERCGPTAYEITQLDVLENPSHLPVQVWRLSWNITGTILTGGSSDGCIRLWKENLLNKWSTIATIKSIEDQKPSDDDPESITSIGSLTRDSLNEKSRAEIEKLYQKESVDELQARMCGKLVFGTAGVRTKMEGGFCRLNDLTILMLTHGFAVHLKNTYNRESNGVAIGFDGRHNSKKWATLAANVFVLNGIKVYLFSDYCPTPLVSYATLKLVCDAGLMITASHNPKYDNGYKAYWTNGAQILSPHDSEICRIAYENGEPNSEYWNTSTLYSHPLFHSADSVLEKYFNEESSLCHYESLNEKCPLKFTYTAFHGVGLPYVTKMMEVFKFRSKNIVIVQEHAKPDPDFPTVPFPNPEEGLKVLKIPISVADQHNSTIILANDPDADRCQVAEKQLNGDWKVFTGNEMGALMSWWVWRCWREQNPEKDSSDVYIVNSVVSSSITHTIAVAEGFKTDVGLTGFKWLGNKCDYLRREGKEVLLAWEESIGFMVGHSLDKDGITAVVVFAEMASYLCSINLTLNQQLVNIFKKYGFHLFISSYWFVPSQTIMRDIFAKLRKEGKYPKKIGTYDVKYVRDLMTGYDDEQPDKKTVLPLSRSSEMITFSLSNGSWTTIRASGTEPKIKYYIEFKSLGGKTEKDLVDMKNELSKLEQAVVDNLLEPKVNGLIARN